MADIKDCIGKEIKIGKTSITIKGENGKTCGVVRDIKKFIDLQANKQIDYFKLLRKSGVWGNKKIDINNVIINDETIYIFRNLKEKQHYKKYGYIDAEEKERIEKTNNIYNSLSEYGIKVIECIM